MAASRLSKKVKEIMTEEMKEIGVLIVNKQCRKMAIDPEDITKEDLPRIARALAQTMSTFGSDKARIIYSKINELSNLEEIVKGADNPEKMMEGLLDLGDAEKYSCNFERSMEHYEHLLELAEENENKEYTAWAHCMIGLLNNDMNDPDTALGNFAKAKKLSGENEEIIQLVFRGMGYSKWRKGAFADSKSLYQKAIELAKEAGNDELLATLMIDLGLVLDMTGNQTEAICSFKEAINIMDKAESRHDICRAYNNIGEVYKFNNEFDRAIEYYDKCYSAAKLDANDLMMSYGIGNSAECYAKKGDITRAKENADQALGICTKMNNDFMLSGVYMTYAIIHAKQNDREKTDEYFQKVFSLLEVMDFPYETAVTDFEYAKVLVQLGCRAEAERKFNTAKRTFRKLKNDKFVDLIDREVEKLRQTV